MNYVDPTGHVAITNSTWLGNLALRIIEVNLAVQMASAGWMPHVEQTIPEAGLRPDIWGENLATATREVYEIKPATVLGNPTRLAEANTQIDQYAAALDATRGTSFTPSKIVFSMGLPGINYITLRTFTITGQPGLVFYEWSFQSLLPEAAAAKLLQKALDKLKRLADQSPPAGEPVPEAAASDTTASPSTLDPPPTVPAPTIPSIPSIPVTPPLVPPVPVNVI